jgi:hypothetical protein
VTRILRNMKAARQVEAVELMIASNTITVAHAEALLKATPPEQRTDVKPAEREKKTAPIEQIEKLEREMNQVQEKYQEAESSYGSDLLNLVVAKGYLTKLLANEAVKSCIGRHEPEILTHLELVVNTVSMEEAVQQQAQTTEATPEEAALGPDRPRSAAQTHHRFANREIVLFNRRTDAGSEVNLFDFLQKCVTPYFLPLDRASRS